MFYFFTSLDGSILIHASPNSVQIKPNSIIATPVQPGQYTISSQLLTNGNGSYITNGNNLQMTNHTNGNDGSSPNTIHLVSSSQHSPQTQQQSPESIQIEPHMFKVIGSNFHNSQRNGTNILTSIGTVNGMIH